MSRKNALSAGRSEGWAREDRWRIPSVSDRDHQALARHTHSPETARRCRIVLLSIDGWPDAAIADQLEVSTKTVTRWRKQFAEQGIAGLLDPTADDQATLGRERTGIAPVLAGEADLDARSPSRPRHDRRPASAGRDWALDVKPRLAATTVDLISAFVSPQLQVAGLLEVPEQNVGTGRRTPSAGPPQEPAENSTTSDVGTIRWLSGSQPAGQQLQEFLRETVHAARGRRLHVVTADVATFAWLRALRSRYTTINLVAHVAANSGAWLDLMDIWASTQEDSDGATLAETTRRLHRRGRRFSWLYPAP